jgi:3-phenylpropionate/trans-cinnamate dioxygenase ferredoxin reductase subunit
MQGNVIIAADCVNAIAEFNVAKKLVTEKITVDTVALADPAIELKSLVAKAM